jgi:hypothetical protein
MQRHNQALEPGGGRAVSRAPVRLPASLDANSSGGVFSAGNCRARDYRSITTERSRLPDVDVEISIPLQGRVS